MVVSDVIPTEICSPFLGDEFFSFSCISSKKRYLRIFHKKTSAGHQDGEFGAMRLELAGACLESSELVV